MNDRPPPDALCYEIRLQGHLEARWSHQFEGMVITLEDDGETLLSGPVADQAALHGLLKKVRDLGVLLISVNRARADHPGGPDAEHPTKSARKKGEK